MKLVAWVDSNSSPSTCSDILCFLLLNRWQSHPASPKGMRHEHMENIISLGWRNMDKRSGTDGGPEIVDRVTAVLLVSKREKCG